MHNKMRMRDIETFLARPVGWWTTLAALCLLLLAPLAVAEIPPILDYPNHIARLLILAQNGRDPVLNAFWLPHWAVIPDLVVDLVGPPLMRIMPPFAVGKILLALALLTPLAGAVAYSRAAFGARLYWPMVAGLMAYNLMFTLGFLNYLISLGGALLAGALWLRLRDKGFIIRGVAGAACGCALFFTHLMGLGFFGLLAGAAEADHLLARRAGQEFGDRRFWRRALGAAALLIISFAGPAILWTQVPRHGGGPGYGGWAWITKIFFLQGPFTAYGFFPGLPIGVAFACATIAWIAKRQCRFAPGAPLVLITLAVSIFALPLSLGGGTFIDSRMPIMLALTIAATIRPAWHRGFPVAIAVAALLVLEVVQVGMIWRAHETEVASFRKTILPVTPGSKVLAITAPLEYGSPYWLAPPPGTLALGVIRTDSHLPALLAIDRRAFWPLLFQDPSQHPIAVQPPYDALSAPGNPPDVASLIAERSLDPDWPAPYLKDWQAHFDFLLLLDAGAVPDLEHFLPDKLQLLNQSSYAALFRVRPPRPTPPS
jgi:hypothetical protein